MGRKNADTVSLTYSQKRRINDMKNEFLANLEENFGLVNLAVSATPRMFTTDLHYKWLKDDFMYKDRVKQIKQASRELVEYHLYKTMESGDLAAIKFWLTTQQPERFTEIQRIEQTTNYMEPIKINIITPETKQLLSNEPEKLEGEEELKELDEFGDKL